MSHTKGSWHWVTLSDRLDLRRSNDQTVLRIKEGAIPMSVDAHLIAAAPELLEALKHAEALIMAKCEPEHPTLRVVRAAIAKAEGKAGGENG